MSLSGVQSAPLVPLPARGPRGDYWSRRRRTIEDLRGNAVAELAEAPGLFITRTLAQMRDGATRREAAERDRMLTEAGTLFATATIDGLTPAAYEETVTLVTGLGISIVRSATARIVSAAATASQRVHAARPEGADPTTTITAGGGFWARRGDVCAILAAGNHPGVHAHWLEALALGYRVAVRPSSREPFTASRLIEALVHAGFDRTEVAFIPTSHDSAENLVHAADRSIVYGGDEVIAKYATDPSVLPQGPGRSKIVVGPGADRDRALDIVVDSVARNGGVSCLNATAVFVSGDAEAFAAAVADRLSRIEVRDAMDPEALLQEVPIAQAQRLVDYTNAQAAGTTPVLSPRVEPLSAGTAAITPAVHLLPRVDAAHARVELPYPCVWIGGWSRDDGVAALRDTLVLSMIGVDDRLVVDALEEPSIRNLYSGEHTTFWSSTRAPHDDYLGAFLMESKGYIGS